MFQNEDFIYEKNSNNNIHYLFNSKYFNQGFIIGAILLPVLYYQEIWQTTIYHYKNYISTGLRKFINHTLKTLDQYNISGKLID